MSSTAICFKDNKVVSNIPSKITEERKFASIRKILDFIKSQGYDFKMHQILIDIGSYKKNKIYGLELQPSIFQPFKDEFIYEVKFLKILAEKFFQEHIASKPNEKWFYDGLIYKLLIDYVETFYPNQKLIGKYAEMFGINKFRFAQLNFNDRFLLGYLLSARVHLDQSLNNSYEKLSNLNNRIVNPYKAAIGLKFLENYLGKQWMKTRIINHLNDKNQKLTFIDQLIEQAPRNIKWFKEDYLETNKKIDYKISRVLVKEDSISLHIKNLTQSAFPLNIQLHNKNGTIDSLWIDGFKHKKKLRIPNKNTVKIALNNLSYYPELYDKNNWYDLSKKWSKKPFKLRLIKDIKNPAYNEVFYIPSLAFNYYDGLILGVQLNNNGFLKTLLNTISIPL